MKPNRSDYLLLSVLLTLLLLGCGSGGGGESTAPAPPGTGTSVSITASTASITADGSSQALITATVLDADGNNVANGTQVVFTTTAGDIDNIKAGAQTTFTSTTNGGTATAYLTSPLSVGTASIRATVGGVSADTTVNFLPGPVSAISLTTTPSNLTANGISQSTIQALVTDSNGNAVADGETITFSVTVGIGLLSAPTANTTGGAATVTYTASAAAGVETVRAQAVNGTSNTVNITLVSATVGSVTVTTGTSSIVANGTSQTTITATVKDTGGNPVGNGTAVSFTATAGTLSSATVNTTGGVATVNLTSPTNVGSATVRATVGGASGDTIVTFIPGPVSFIALTATPDNVTANGVSTSTIRALVLDAHNNIVDNGQTITFNVTAGTGTLSLPFATTTNGIASVTYTASTAAGTTATVTALSTNGITNTVNITLVSAIVGSVTVTAGTSEIVADGSSLVSIFATVKDIGGDLVVNGTVVSFTTTAGTLSGITTTSSGIATATLTSPTSVGFATVRATVGGVSGQVTVNFVPGPVSAISLAATPNNLTANGLSQSTIRAVVTDSNGNAVADGETITFIVTAGSGLLSAPTANTTGGAATVTYTASTTAGAETVTARSTNGVNTTVPITLIAGTVGSVTVAAGSASIVANGTSQTTITATVKDTGGNPIEDGTVVTFTTTPGWGTLSAASANTTAGVAFVTLTSAASVGTATVRATAGSVSNEIVVNFVPGPVNSITLTATPSNLTADGTSTSLIRAVVTDAQGNTVANGESISFVVASGTGTLSTASVTTTAGVATVTYTASAAVGTEIVTAQSTNGTSNTVNIPLIAGTVGSVTLTAGAASLVADGISSTLITATVKGTGGNPIGNGTVVSFLTTAGTLSAASSATFGGVATVTLFSPTTVGTAALTATAGSITQVVSVRFTPGPAANVAQTTLTANPTVLPADGTSTAQITAYFVDANNNPVLNGTSVSFSNTAGTLSAATQTTGNGAAAVTLKSSTNNETATVTAVADGVTRTVSVKFGSGTGSGEPVSIMISVSATTIQVKGTGGTEATTITASVKDENGQPYNDSAGNITFEILTGPGGGEMLDSGDGSPSASETTGTTGGIASVSLKSGTLPGTVRIKVTVLKDGSGGFLATPLEAISTPIGIEAGPPFNISVYQSSTVEDNGDGSISRIVSALVRDQYGNPVADNTGVYFGLVDNLPNGYKSSGANGVTTSGFKTFTSAGTNFVSDGVVQFDTLIIREGGDEGGHIIDVPANGSVTLYDPMVGTAGSLDFVAGNAELGTICGVAPTGNLVPDASCTPAGGTAVKGVAHTRLTWYAPAIFKPFYLYAETEGRDKGDSLANSYAGVEPITIDVILIPSTVTGGATGISVFAHLHDGAAHDIQGETLTFRTSNTIDSGFGGVPGAATTTATTDVNGRASVSNLDTGVLANTTVTITVSIGPYSGTVALTITP